MSADQQQHVLLEKVDLDESSQPTAVVNPPSYTPAATAMKPPMPDTSRPTDPSLNTVYMAIFAMLFCCWPCGLVGLIYGIQGMQEYYRGQYDSSERTEKRAKKWVICSIVTGVVLVVGITFFVIVSQAITYGLVFSQPYDRTD